MCIELFVIISDDGLNFCGICGDIPFFLLLQFGYSLFSFLLIWLVVYFVDLLGKSAPGFIDFLKVFFCLYLLQFCSDLSYFLSSASF